MIKKCLSTKLLYSYRFLATGDLYRSISLAYRVGKSTVAGIVPDTCSAIWNVLQPLFLVPPSQDNFKEIAKDFNRIWNFPNCIGAIDGKHVVLVAPPNGGSVFFNYKGTHSIVLMAACDAQYRFTHVDIGNYGRISDGGVFGASALGQGLRAQNICPAPVMVPDHELLPYVFVADDAFPLGVNLLKPFPGLNLGKDSRIFNYRLSRARRCIENSFGIMSARWRALRKELSIFPDNAVLVVQAVVCLHNFLMTKDGELRTRYYCPHGFSDYPDCVGNVVDGEWRRQGTGTGLANIRHQGSNMYPRNASNVRDSFKRYFVGKGAVAWQNQFT